MRRIAIAAALVAASTAAHAHDWYPRECCSDKDCAPALSVQNAPGGWWVTTIHGAVFVPADFTRLESKDNRVHACMRPRWPAGAEPKMKLICVFFPPET